MRLVARTVLICSLVIATLVGGIALRQRWSRRPADDEVETFRRSLEETGGKGLWSVARPRASARRKHLAERLFALGYLDGMRSAENVQSGVTTYDPKRAWNGLNLYVDGHGQEADLIDMRGEVVHRWSFDLDRAGKGFPRGSRYFRHAALLPNGDLLVLYDHRALVKLDKDSHLVWIYKRNPHHAFQVLPDGTITALTAERRSYPPWSTEHKILDNDIVRLDADGRELSRISIVNAIQRSGVPGLWNRLRELAPTKLGRLGDVLHANSVQVLLQNFSHQVPWLRPGTMLVSLPVLNSVVLVDPSMSSVTWVLQGTFRYQHSAELLQTGHILLFDNQRGEDERSSVLEYDPVTREPTWSYRGTPENPLFSWCCGTTHRLPNGNTLIVETEGGRALEVTPAGETVWEFVNPHRAGKDNELIAQMFDMVRIAPHTLTWLANR